MEFGGGNEHPIEVLVKLVLTTHQHSLLLQSHRQRMMLILSSNHRHRLTPKPKLNGMKTCVVQSIAPPPKVFQKIPMDLSSVMEMNLRLRLLPLRRQPIHISCHQTKLTLSANDCGSKHQSNETSRSEQGNVLTRACSSKNRPPL